MGTNCAANGEGRNQGVLGTNEQSMVALVKASPLGIVAFDLDGKILLWNHAAEEITGWREEEVLGLPIGVLADEKWEGYEVLRRRTLNREVFHSLPMDATRKDGRGIIISYSSAPVFDSENRIVAIMAVIYDISGPKRKPGENEPASGRDGPLFEFRSGKKGPIHCGASATGGPTGLCTCSGTRGNCG